MNILKKLKSWVKKKLAIEITSLAIEAEKSDNDLFAKIKEKLDKDKNKKFTFNDVFLLAKEYFGIDADCDGEVDIWEYILFFFKLRAAVKKAKGE